MKKLLFMAGIGVGFVLGSRAGRGPYEQVEGKVRELSGKPAVRQTMDQVSGAVKEQANAVAQKVTDKLPSGNGAGQHDPAHPRS